GRRVALRVLVLLACPNMARPHLREPVVFSVRRDRARMKPALVVDDRDARQGIEIMLFGFDLERGGVSRRFRLIDLGVSKANGQNDGCDRAKHRPNMLTEPPTLRYMPPLRA